MTLTLRQSATQVDLAECASTTTAQIWALAKLQIRIGPSWALLTADGAVVGCGGYVPRDLDEQEAWSWFVVSPLAARHMRGVVAAVQLTACQAGYHRIIGSVSTPEGRRIAEMCGYRHIETRDDGMEVFEWQA